jgi:hypothetical protein
MDPYDMLFAVARLKNILRKLSVRQKEFLKQISEPVQTTIEVQAGPPGPLTKK